MRISSILLQQSAPVVINNGEFGGNATAVPPPSAVTQEFARLAAQDLTFRQGILDLQAELSELRSNRRSANQWGLVAVVCNVTLIPLNAIVNGMELKAANTALKVVYQEAAKMLYKKNAASGTRLKDDSAKKALSVLKTALVEALKSKGLKDFIPGVQIVVGLAEDSLVLYQTMAMIDDGNREMSGTEQMIANLIRKMELELTRLGIRRAEMLAKAERLTRTV